MADEVKEAVKEVSRVTELEGKYKQQLAYIEKLKNETMAATEVLIMIKGALAEADGGLKLNTKEEAKKDK